LFASASGAMNQIRGTQKTKQRDRREKRGAKKRPAAEVLAHSYSEKEKVGEHKRTRKKSMEQQPDIMQGGGNKRVGGRRKN